MTAQRRTARATSRRGYNYAMSLKPGMEAHAAGYAENLYLDSESPHLCRGDWRCQRAVRRQGTAGDGAEFPYGLDPALHPRRSLVQVAKDLGITVDERPVTSAEVQSGAFTECGLCGTAAVISPVGEIHDGDEVDGIPGCRETCRPGDGSRMRARITGIQAGEIGIGGLGVQDLLRRVVA